MKLVTIDGLKFACADHIEVARAESLLTKEPGTIDWLMRTVQQGDVVYDIGANIGVYTLFAARLVGPLGTVYAFEPHIANASALFENVLLNGLQHIVKVSTCALGERMAMDLFNYVSLRRGSSGSQAGHTTGETGESFEPALREIKACVPLDAISDLRKPDVIKLDVDGNELSILKGAKQLLLSAAPRSLQVEMRGSNAEQVKFFLATMGYRFSHRHDTALGQKRIAQGANVEEIGHNGVFLRGGTFDTLHHRTT